MKKRYRVMHKFWLDITKTEEDSLDEQIHELKQNRKFVTTIRDGIRLICDLRAGRLEVLFELFPFVRAEFLEYLQSVQPEKSPGELALEAQLNRLEQLMLQQGGQAVESGPILGTNGASSGPKPMAVPQFEVPACDEADDFALDIRADTRTQTAHNFVQSMLSLQQ